MSRSVLFWIVPVGSGIILALVTGISSLASNLSFYYGLPLGWRLAYCPIVQPFGCPMYNWLALFLDALFFIAIGFAVIAILFPMLERLRTSRANGPAQDGPDLRAFWSMSDFYSLAMTGSGFLLLI